MGHTYSKVLNIVIKPFRYYNVENRVQTQLERQAKTIYAAPHHVQKNLNAITEENQSKSRIATESKDNSLVDRVKQFSISSANIEQGPLISSRKLPQEKLYPSGPYDPLYYLKPSPGSVEPGKIPLQEAIRLIDAAAKNEEKAPIDKETISKKFSCDMKDIDNILDYFKSFDLVVPEVIDANDLHGSKVFRGPVKAKRLAIPSPDSIPAPVTEHIKPDKDMSALRTDDIVDAASGTLPPIEKEHTGGSSAKR